MLRRVSPVSLLAAAFALAGPALEALAQPVEHEAVGAVPSVKQGVVSAVTAIVVFLLVLAVLQLKVWPVITKALDERAAKIRSEIDAAEQARQQARDALATYQKSLAEARAEAQRMLDQTRAQQGALAAELKARADAELSQLRERAMKDIEQARRAAVSEIYGEASNLASAIAGKILKREVRPADQQALVEESLSALRAGAR